MAGLLVMLLVALSLPATRAQAQHNGCFEYFSGATDCGASPNACFVLCGICAQPFLQMGFTNTANASCASLKAVSDDAIYSAATDAFFNVSALHGYTWLDDAGDVEANASACFQHLLAHMPRRDLIVLFSTPFHTIDFLFEHIRFALLARRSYAFTQSIPWELFLDAVLPYALLNEKRDFWWRSRPRLYQTLSASISSAPNVTAALHILTAVIPTLELEGLFSDTAGAYFPGPPVSWRSESSPAFLSPQQTVQMGASCTGTAILLAAACRAVGIPARLAGCSESVVAGDDHHWIEFFDPLDKGPFGDFWHTREGVSNGASDGPWDYPSGPMGGCLQGVQPFDPLHTIWGGSWNSSEFLPLMWASTEYYATWSFVGGVNRCGAYCTAWGCGPQRDQHYTQEQCHIKTY